MSPLAHDGDFYHFQGIEEQRGGPVARDVAVKGLLERARGLCAEQESRAAELEANYSESFSRASKENWTGTYWRWRCHW